MEKAITRYQVVKVRDALRFIEYEEQKEIPNQYKIKLYKAVIQRYLKYYGEDKKKLEEKICMSGYTPVITVLLESIGYRLILDYKETINFLLECGMRKRNRVSRVLLK